MKRRETKKEDMYAFVILIVVLLSLWIGDGVYVRFGYIFHQDQCELLEARITNLKVIRSSGRYRNSYQKATYTYTYQGYSYSTQMEAMVGDQIGDKVVIAVRTDKPTKIYRLQGFGSRWVTLSILTVMLMIITIGTECKFIFKKKRKPRKKTRRKSVENQL